MHIAQFYFHEVGKEEQVIRGVSGMESSHLKGAVSGSRMRRLHGEFQRPSASPGGQLLEYIPFVKI